MNETLRNEAYISVIGWLQANPDAGVGSAAQWLRNSADWADRNIPANTAIAIAERARAAMNLAADLQDDPARVPRIGEVPDRIGREPFETRFQYQVVVVALDASGNLATTMMSVNSEVPLSYDQARDAAIAALPTRGTAGKRAVREAVAANPEVAPDVYLIAVGRR